MLEDDCNGYGRWKLPQKTYLTHIPSVLALILFSPFTEKFRLIRGEMSLSLSPRGLSAASVAPRRKRFIPYRCINQRRDEESYERKDPCKCHTSNTAGERRKFEISKISLVYELATRHYHTCLRTQMQTSILICKCYHPHPNRHTNKTNQNTEKFKKLNVLLMTKWPLRHTKEGEDGRMKRKHQ